ncbi:MAG: hypothetical protein KDG51_06255, partial [Calditrichaeota bacterium]|nr:hypothetical protein [Calditrichota bacterium]
ENDYPKLLEQVYAAAESPADGASTGEPTGASIASLTSVIKNIAFDKAWLADDADVDNYLELLREALRTGIRNGKRIQI